MLSKEAAIELTRGAYATEVERAVAGSIAPFLWRERDEAGQIRIRNGTAFFFEAARQIVMVTADHVLKHYLKAREKWGQFARCQIANLRIIPEERVIARSEILDIATFRIGRDEIARTKEGGFPMSFAPLIPEVGKGVLFAGFPSAARQLLSQREMVNGIFTGLLVADNIGDLQISGALHREYQVDKPGRPTAPVGYDIGGVSGGPLITMVDSTYLHYWRLGGVMIEYHTDFEIYRATRADFILPDGTLANPQPLQIGRVAND
jgi:hypothetical protein